MEDKKIKIVGSGIGFIAFALFVVAVSIMATGDKIIEACVK